mmetsp:Transcript_2007/g.7561  ORF Transcript_2007/g.7561 Transcript_2007/m.7561 type:complete len:255 (-) Transcript_2007:668-1432(-)
MIRMRFGRDGRRVGRPRAPSLRLLPKLPLDGLLRRHQLVLPRADVRGGRARHPTVAPPDPVPLFCRSQSPVGANLDPRVADGLDGVLGVSRPQARSERVDVGIVRVVVLVPHVDPARGIGRDGLLERLVLERLLVVFVLLVFHLATQPAHPEPLNLLLERHRGTGPREDPVFTRVRRRFTRPVGVRERLGRASGPEPQPSRSIRRLFGSAQSVRLLRLGDRALGLGEGNLGARVVLRWGLPQPSRGPTSLGLVG